MTPVSIPVIGSGFDAVAGQQMGWANYNRGVDEANLARRAASEQTQNNYMAAMQALQQRAADRDTEAYQRAQEYGASLTAQADANRFSAAQEAQRLKEESRRTDAMLATQRATAQKGEDKITNVGSQYAFDYSSANDTLQAAAKAEAAARDAYQSKIDRQAQLATAKERTPDDIKEQTDISGQLKTLKVAHTKAEQARLAAEKHFNSILDKIQASDYSVDSTSGAIVHRPTLKKWSIRAGAQPAPGFTFTSGSTEWTKPILPSNPMFAPTGTTTETAAAAPQKIGHFTIVSE